MIIDNRSNRTNIAKVVKEFIFPKMKFITSLYELEYNKDDESVSQIVLTNMTVKSTEVKRVLFWNIMKKYVPNALNKKRGNVTRSIKAKFLSKFKSKLYPKCYPYKLIMCSNNRLS